MKIKPAMGAFVAVLASGFGQLAFAECSNNSVTLRGDWGQARFSVEVADDPAERAQGLMYREAMATSAGMLFVYPHPQTVGFWMKNTLIPLDMIFADETGLVVRIHENAIPHDLDVIDGGDGVLAVLEINGGMASAMGISVGSAMQHPSFEQKNPVWPCNEP